MSKNYNNFFESEVNGGNVEYSTFEVEEFLNDDPIIDEGLVSKILRNCTINARKRKRDVYLKRVKNLFCKEKIFNK